MTTPGPWHAEYDPIVEESEGVGDFWTICSEAGDVVAMDIFDKEDAQLLASAPLLLSALEVFVEEYQDVSLGARAYLARSIDHALAAVNAAKMAVTP